jgi:hypothetical protein
MKDKSILFSTPMVRAIQDERKSMTRRIVKPQPDKEISQMVGWQSWLKCPYGQPGDILWVRETWNYSPNWYYCYKADTIPDDNHGYIGSIPWRPSIFMPREAARIFLRVKTVRVERLQEITEEDARAEGCCTFHDHIADGKFAGVAEFDLTARDAFADLWDSINAKRGYGWDSNPFVWAISFKVLEGGKLSA